VSPYHSLFVFLPFEIDNALSPSTFKLSYTQKHTRLFLDQVHSNTIGGFTPNANTPDPNWGRCLQCAAIDRARYKLAEIPSRSAFCTQCFQQYCFDPQNPPSESELPNRKLGFVDPDPIGLAQLEDFFAYSKFKLIGGLIGLVAFIGILIYGLCVLFAFNALVEMTFSLTVSAAEYGGRNVRIEG